MAESFGWTYGGPAKFPVSTPITWIRATLFCIRVAEDRSKDKVEQAEKYVGRLVVTREQGGSDAGVEGPLVLQDTQDVPRHIPGLAASQLYWRRRSLLLGNLGGGCGGIDRRFAVANDQHPSCIAKHVVRATSRGVNDLAAFGLKVSQSLNRKNVGFGGDQSVADHHKCERSSGKVIEFYDPIVFCRAKDASHVGVEFELGHHALFSNKLFQILAHLVGGRSWGIRSVADVLGKFLAGVFIELKGGLHWTALKSVST